MNYRHIYMRNNAHAKLEMKEGKRPLNHKDKKNFPNQYFEFHHIFPRSLFPQYKNFVQNLVALTAREHFFCHELLTKIWPSRQMYTALFYLSNDKKHKCSSKEYERIREEFSKSQSVHKKGKYYGYTVTQAVINGRKIAGEKRKGRTPWNKGKHLNKETIEKIKIARQKQDMSWRKDPKKSKELREKISKANKGRKIGTCWNKGKKLSLSSESRQKMGQKGIKVWHKGEEHKKSFECPGEGWIRGFSEKRKSICKNKKHIKGLDIASENLSASESKIRDTDLAEKMVEYVKDQILEQTSLAFIAQANNQSQNVLTLLD